MVPSAEVKILWDWQISVRIKGITDSLVRDKVESFRLSKVASHFILIKIFKSIGFLFGHCLCVKHYLWVQLALDVCEVCFENPDATCQDKEEASLEGLDHDLVGDGFAASEKERVD